MMTPIRPQQEAIIDRASLYINLCRLCARVWTHDLMAKNGVEPRGKHKFAPEEEVDTGKHGFQESYQDTVAEDFAMEKNLCN